MYRVVERKQGNKIWKNKKKQNKTKLQPTELISIDPL